MTTNEESSLPVFPTSQAGECAALLTWETLFDAIEDGVCVQSLDSRIVCANGAFADIIGAPLEQIVGRACAEVFGCANETGAIPQFCARSVSDETGRAEYEEISGKHPGRRLRSRVSPVRDDSGKIIAYLMVVRDITETVAHEREINRRQHAARFGELAASLAHEIKNPLAGIQGAVDILIQRRSPNDPERKLLEGVRGEVGRIDAIIRSMLDRAQPGTLNLQPVLQHESQRRGTGAARGQTHRSRARRSSRSGIHSGPRLHFHDSATARIYGLRKRMLATNEHEYSRMDTRRLNSLTDFSRDLLLRDGAMLRFRALRPGDRGVLKDLLSRCSPGSIR